MPPELPARIRDGFGCLDLNRDAFRLYVGPGPWLYSVPYRAASRFAVVL